MQMTNLLLLVSIGGLLSASLFLALALLQESLRDQDVILGGDGTVGTFRLVRSPRAITSLGWIERRSENCQRKCDILSGG